MLTKSRLLINQLIYFFLAGAFAVFLDYLVYKLTFNSLGSIAKGKNPGLNLITNIKNLKLTNESVVKPLLI